MWRTVLFAKTLSREVSRKQIQPAFRQFATSGYRDPGWMVDTECEIDSDLVKIPVFTDVVRQDLFKKWREDPETWTIPALSMHFNCTIQRTKAVILLLTIREDLMKKNNVLDIPDVWNKIFDKHLEDPILNTVELLAVEHELPVDDIKSIIKRLIDHRARYVRMNMVLNDFDIRP